MSDRNEELIQWIKQSIGTDKCSVILGNSSEKGEGYIADIIFAKVMLEEYRKELDLVIKVTKSAKGIREHWKEFCEREVVFYNEIIPIFKQFQKERNIVKPFDALATCYKAFCTEETEVMVLENMKAQGYEMIEGKKTLNINHIKLALRYYAKFHAISFALKDQKPNIFNKIEDIYPNLVKKFPMKFKESLYDRKSKVSQNLSEIGRKDLAEKYEKFVNKEIVDMLMNIANDVPQEKVVTQIDCHSGNYLFKYEDENKECPSEMVLIDFQLSSLHSPMFDIGLFWYFAASKEEFAHFTEMMHLYHKELAIFLTELGSDVDKLFPISKMWEHWKKYSTYGFLLATSALEMLYVDKEDVPNLSEMGSDLFNFEIRNRSAYLKRLRDIVDFFFTQDN